MTLADLIHHVQRDTECAESSIREIVSAAWPDHQQFTQTQAALVAHAVRRREAGNAQSL